MLLLFVGVDAFNVCDGGMAVVMIVNVVVIARIAVAVAVTVAAAVVLVGWRL